MCKDNKISDFSYICKAVTYRQPSLTNKFKAMKYLIRAVKYFFYFAILTTVIVLALVLIGAVESDINTIFEDGYGSLWKIAMFFAVIAAVYPKFGFITRKLDVQQAGWEQISDVATEYFSEHRYVVESRAKECITFRRRDIAGRIAKMGEDRITLSSTEDGYILEGLRKDLILYATGLEYRLQPHKDEQEQ